MRWAETLASAGVEPLDVVLQCIALELIPVSSQYEQETVPTLKAIGAMVAGLFGMDQADDADELLHDLNAPERATSASSARTVARPAAISSASGRRPFTSPGGVVAPDLLEESRRRAPSADSSSV